MGDRIERDPSIIVQSALDGKDGKKYAAEFEAMIAEVVAGHAEERKRCEAFTAKLDVVPEGKQLKYDGTPMFTAFKWCSVADARDSKAA
jgi:hypothetical protein